MRCGWGTGVLVAALAACEPMPPTGRPFEPVPIASPAPPAPVPRGGGERTPVDEASPFADDRVEMPEPTAPRGGRTVLGPDGQVHELAAAAPAAGAAPPPGMAAPVPGPVPQWDPQMPLPDVSFGVQVTGVLADRFPPRAVLALPDGNEVVVQPGTMLPQHGIVVLAIGQNGVRLAHVSPAGYQARVVTETIGVLSPVEGPPD